MDLISAVKSGKRFKRKQILCWTSSALTVDREDILADDWEIEEEKITITKEEFKRACLSGWGIEESWNALLEKK